MARLEFKNNRKLINSIMESYPIFDYVERDNSIYVYFKYRLICKRPLIFKRNDDDFVTVVDDNDSFAIVFNLSKHEATLIIYKTNLPKQFYFQMYDLNINVNSMGKDDTQAIKRQWQLNKILE